MEANSSTDGPWPHNPYLRCLYQQFGDQAACQELKALLAGADTAPTPQEHKDFVANLLFAAICWVILMFLMLVAYKVYRIVRWQDPIVLCMILFLNLELICKSTRLLIRPFS